MSVISPSPPFCVELAGVGERRVGCKKFLFKFLPGGFCTIPFSPGHIESGGIGSICFSSIIGRVERDWFDVLAYQIKTSLKG